VMEYEDESNSSEPAKEHEVQWRQDIVHWKRKKWVASSLVLIVNDTCYLYVW
jgi:hypothetical protein